MNRIRNHIIEDESEHILKGIIPSEWVTRKLSPDYAIDYLVEVFHNNKATGEHFFIQLKGTDKLDIKDRINLRLDRKYLDYYTKLSLPILLVYCSVKSKKLWGKWMNRSAVGKNAKSRIISFSSTDMLTSESLYAIAKALSTNSGPIRIKYQNDLNNGIQSFLERWINSLFADVIAKNANTISDELILIVTGDHSEDISVQIKDDRFLMDGKCSIAKLYKKDILLIPEVDSIPNSLHSFLYSLARILLERNSKDALCVMRELVLKLSDDNFEDIFTIVTKSIGRKE